MSTVDAEEADTHRKQTQQRRPLFSVGWSVFGVRAPATMGIGGTTCGLATEVTILEMGRRLTLHWLKSTVFEGAPTVSGNATG